MCLIDQKATNGMSTLLQLAADGNKSKDSGSLQQPCVDSGSPN
jgi:hypothetical protein